ncbi:MAG: hypothetical protein ABL958_14055 [Bdellovibrionia bacterium]
MNKSKWDALLKEESVKSPAELKAFCNSPRAEVATLDFGNVDIMQKSFVGLKKLAPTLDGAGITVVPDPAEPAPIKPSEFIQRYVSSFKPQGSRVSAKFWCELDAFYKRGFAEPIMYYADLKPGQMPDSLPSDVPPEGQMPIRDDVTSKFNLWGEVYRGLAPTYESTVRSRGGLDLACSGGVSSGLPTPGFGKSAAPGSGQSF